MTMPGTSTWSCAKRTIGHSREGSNICRRQSSELAGSTSSSRHGRRGAEAIGLVPERAHALHKKNYYEELFAQTARVPAAFGIRLHSCTLLRARLRQSGWAMAANATDNVPSGELHALAFFNRARRDPQLIGRLGGTMYRSGQPKQ
jgi:hypothetical protein